MARPRIEFPLAEVERMAALGMTQAQIARALGISADTLERRKADTEAVRLALEQGRARGVDLIAQALFESAVKGNVRAQIFYLKANAGWSETKHRPYTDPPYGHPEEQPEVRTTSAREKLREMLSRLARAGSDEAEWTTPRPENADDGAAKPAKPPALLTGSKDGGGQRPGLQRT